MPSSTTTSNAVAPKWLQDLLTGPRGAATQFGAFQAGAPTLLELLGQVPGLEVPGLTADQATYLSQLEQAGANNQDLAAARSQLQTLTSGDIGSSPATAAGMKAFRELVLPQVQQQQALQGTASGGAGLEAVSNATTAAALPLIQNEIATRENAVGQYGQLGQEQLQSIAQALEASGLPREVAFEQAQALFDQAQQKFGFTTGLETAPLSMLPAFIGNISRTHGTMSAEDWVSGIAKGLSPQGIVGSFGGGGSK